MRCPRCNNSGLDERVREGVTIDICRQCRGIWLDRGELEKLVARERNDYEDYYKDYDTYRAQRYPQGQSYPQGKSYPQGGRYPGHKRPKSFFESLGDIFD